MRNPVILPCGNSFCKSCMPPPHEVAVGPPALKLDSFECPFESCGEDHRIIDCSNDVTLGKILERVSIEAARSRPLTPDTPTMLEERGPWRNAAGSAKDSNPPSRVLNGGRLLATYTMAELGELKYESEVTYQTMSPTGDAYEHLDTAMLSRLVEATKNEVECHVCYGLMLDPLTTVCGHTFCRRCVARVLDHSTMCPVCRRGLPMSLVLHRNPGNRTISRILNGLCPELVAARAELVKQEEAALGGEKNMPIFVCTLAWPTMPCFLHIFEPRYRLMIRRAVETGDRKFGMIMYNRTGEQQGGLGNVHFMEYGTLLHIDNVQMLPDGRSLIETRGISRFRVKEHGQLDGYMTGNVERVDDIPWAEEEENEALEVMGPHPQVSSGRYGELDHMSTTDLVKIGTDFITKMQAASAAWLHERVIHSYGPLPTDPSLFPYWLANILPIQDEEKYRLLPTTSVRERLKICATWVRIIEAQRW